MSNTRLDYSDSIHEREESSHEGTLNSISVTITRPAGGILDFQITPGYCPYCRRTASSVFHDLRKATLQLEFYSFLQIWECETCGWWECEGRFSEEEDLLGKVKEYLTIDRIHAVARSFDLSDKQAPLDALAREISRNPASTCTINATRFEQLAQAVLRNYFDCDVRHIGRSHDGGVDLVVVEANDPILVQVKRRESLGYIESVSTVRDFLGAMFIENRARGIVLSTADRFSRASQKVADKLISEGRLKMFDLIDFNSFLKMLRVNSGIGTPSWHQFRDRWVADGSLVAQPGGARDAAR